MPEIDYSAFARALARPAEGLAVYQAETGNAFYQDALILRFEFTYELASRRLRRHLAAASGTPAEIDQMSFPTLIRTASEKGLLLSGWNRWVVFRRRIAPDLLLLQPVQ